MKWTILSALLFLLASCKKYLDVPLPINEIASQSAFSNDAAAGASLNAIYAGLFTSDVFGGTSGVGYATGMYGDELTNYNSLNTSFQAVYQDEVSSTLGGVTATWSTLYTQMYAINQAIAYIPQSSSLVYQNQWLGEAYFLRGLCYFYLTNLYGDVPLVLTTDYLANNSLARTPQAGVYTQIISDLKMAQSLLSDAYHNGSGSATADRGRPNRMAATALLSRTYLYTSQWANAESEADSLLGDATDYQLAAPAGVFLINSKEIIWGLVPLGSPYPAYAVQDAPVYYLAPGTIPPATGVAVALSDSLVKAFEPNDTRFTNWVSVDSTTGGVLYFAYKYKAFKNLTAPVESTVMLRLGEQYLIRAEARAEQNNLSGAAADLNAVRARAGLGVTTAVTQAALLSAILKERRIELFLENGNRFLDLRRTGNLDAVMGSVATAKGGSWSSYKEWWPIPATDIQNDKQLTQTPGFQ
ncbi:RagB/SusD family nutrient uptake outer membrane protein [Dinghuibacter silviterrae]|uniref:Putative outer membrane starch-binding protein n=1 Tax=Dinghuibacter silviterrae TaxID=1539049 RepID=A0A4R8DTB6_9BACT|nr:RagB/SusD family nutrient uptake outer membrane protein [Dinghuibacter silviterrae]TDX01542.1 putative outer membrane starch-binding protein [Dinghuibacter silviterrae]